jgi:hypothetical protein
MTKEPSIEKEIRALRGGRLLFLPHAVRQMARPDRMISTQEVREVVEQGEIVEDYPEDARGHSCLMPGFGLDHRPVHVVCAPKGEYLAIITAYLPDPNDWNADFKTRSKP